MAKKDIKYYWGKDHLLVVLGNRTERRIRLLFMFEFIVTIAFAGAFLLRSFPVFGGFSHIATFIGGVFIFAVAGYRFLSRIFFNEKVLLEKETITIIRRTPFRQREATYEWENISTLHYAGVPSKTDHPLKGKSFDYWGFETHEHVVQSLHHAGNLYFDNGRERVYFARGVYSWDAEEMVGMMKLFTGRSLELKVSESNLFTSLFP